MYQEETVQIEFGTVCIELHCQDQEFMEKVRLNYRPFLALCPPDFRIRFNLRNSRTAAEIKQLLTNSRSYVDGDRFVTEAELLECRISWAEATVWVDTEKELFDPSVEYKLMNALLRGIYSGIHKKVWNRTPGADLVHGCGIMDGERCYLFTGPSGSGKTTIAVLSDGRKVLNDEAVLVGRDNEKFYLSGTPFDGSASHRCNASGYLSAILFLRHDTKASLRKLSKVETYQRFLIQVFDTSPLLEAPGIDSLQARAELSAEVASEVPSYELGFRPDTSFWPLVEHI